MGEWIDCTLGDILTLQRGFDLPMRDRQEGAFPVVASTGIVATHNEAKVKGPGVVIGRSGSIGGGQYITTDFWPLNTTLWVKDFKGNDERFCYYLLKSLDFSSFNVGSGVPTLNRNHVHPWPLHCPNPTEQRDIANVLSALDDKIELNRRTNETLERLAQAIFKDWFVDFGPVRRKQAGKTDPTAILGGLLPPSEKATQTAALFPDTFGDNGLPEGWGEGTLDDLASNAGKSVKPEDLSTSTPYIGLEHMPRGSIALSDRETVEKVTSTKAQFKRGQVLFGKLRPYFHKVGIAPFDGVSSTDIVIMDATNQRDRALLTCIASSDEFVAYTVAGSTGTKMPRTSWKLMKQYPIAISPENVKQAFAQFVTPKLDSIQYRIMQNQTLAQTRDYLLPKLMSGQIRAGDVESMVV